VLNKAERILPSSVYGATLVDLIRLLRTSAFAVLPIQKSNAEEAAMAAKQSRNNGRTFCNCFAFLFIFLGSLRTGVPVMLDFLLELPLLAVLRYLSELCASAPKPRVQTFLAFLVAAALPWVDWNNAGSRRKAAKTNTRCT